MAGLLLAAAGPAQAADYRYWSFWRGNSGGWAYQQQGPAMYQPPDGSVDGWRFTLSQGVGQADERPGAAPDFATLCANVPAQPGRKRVGVVLDFGTPADAPSAHADPPSLRTTCTQVPTQASSAEVLAAIAPPLRYDTNGILCAIAGYPVTGCGEALTGPAPAAAAAPTAPHATAPALPLPAALALIALVAGGAAWLAHRRRTATHSTPDRP
ncbi:SCO2322 family protein [Kitasatospora acidiphila]|uniref:SCO2322 family protein n=1 Tax=Kitasatospora acidiphila TaxID=2567942 RepID=UPI001E2918D1|nr:SCO2322 family protein [Kitasatospora acidiphila]